ncbi:TIGR03086 family metal-binding protein [Geodermatophilus marinus]|uniref:TIGR03086 family metal-binding protein n=1 Tax=Geodermatophilus sp. LHW52908 TaxID=2303986 RepID=UPI000E3C6536|nr:TIGR03086 family metal-binding protein [Geodermatophilus sp. LHW52908]RFU19106.1 TIGR03086 family protein [Geodermatophilus sp. LHW52908]
MRSTAERWRDLAGAFTRVAEAVPADGWDRPAPCEGWVARDVVRHLVGWMPGLFLDSAGLPLPAAPRVDDDPAGAWRAVATAVQAALDDPETAQRPTQTRAGSMTLEQLVAMTGLMDLLVHAWDLARATGQDESLDPVEVHTSLTAIEPWDAALRASGHYGPRVPVPGDADEQARLLAFTGRQP